jgi:hypothetical protein
MTHLTPAPVRSTREDAEPPGPPQPPEPPPEGGLTVFLWVVAALIALAEVLWWVSDRIYSS